MITNSECVLSLVEAFIHQFFDENPLSLLGIIITREGIAELVSPLTSNVSTLSSSIKRRENREPRGEASLQNSLELARTWLSHVPAHCLREIVIISSSLTSCDPGNIFDTVESIKAEKIRTSIVGLSAQVKICETIAKETGGSCRVAMNESHFKDVLFSSITPPAVAKSNSSAALVKMGFPQIKFLDYPTFCAWYS